MLTRRLLLAVLLAVGLIASPAPAPASAMPAGFGHLHTYAEVTAEVQRLARDYPDIVQTFSIGKSYQGRELWAVKISDNAAVDEAEPEVAVGALIHARERMSNEMAMYLLRVLTDGYGADARVTNLVDSREIFILPMLNPDGAEYDTRGGRFRSWRKNRQPIPGSRHVGIDLNRQFSYQWNCCGGGSNRPRSEQYRGWAPFVAPEAIAYRDFVNSRVVDGRQQLTGFLNLHSEGRMVLWPYAYTYEDRPATMTSDDHAAFSSLGRQMAALNGYRARQGSDLYIVDGDHDDWLYHEHRIFAFTFELTRTSKRHYPTVAEVRREAARNHDAFMLFLGQADCYYRAAGLADTHCGPLNEDFEISTGWRTNPFGTDTATGGRWRRARPAQTTDGTGVLQRATAASGQFSLVTGPGGGRAAADDVDGGVTSVVSPRIRLPNKRWQLTFRFTFAHDARSTAADFLRVSVLANGRRTLIWQRRGHGAVRSATWRTAKVGLAAFRGQRIRLLIEAADGGRANLVEAAVDDVRIFRAP